MPASVTQLDARPTGDQAFVGSGGCGLDSCRVGNILSRRLIMKYFFMVVLSLPLIQEGQLLFSGERRCTILVNRSEDQTCPVKVWLAKLTALDMTPLG